MCVFVCLVQGKVLVDKKIKHVLTLIISLENYKRQQQQLISYSYARFVKCQTPPTSVNIMVVKGMIKYFGPGQNFESIHSVYNIKFYSWSERISNI